MTEEKNDHSYPLRVRVHAHGLSGTNNRCLSSLSLHETTRRIISTSEWQASPQHGKLLCTFVVVVVVVVLLLFFKRLVSKTNKEVSPNRNEH